MSPKHQPNCADTNTVGERRQPPALAPGDTVGVVAPASPVDPQKLERGIQLLKNYGFRVKVGKHVLGRSSLFAATDRERAEDLCCMLESQEVKAIFCARGGYGSQRLLPLIASLAKKVQPKIFVGYSDITALHSLFQQYGWVTWHGPMPGDWVGMADHGFSVDALFAWLTGQANGHIALPVGTHPFAIRPGRATGRLVGGNLSLVAALQGTPYEVDTDDAILFIEDIGEAPYRVDRMLSSLHLAGKLDPLQGVVLGDFTDCNPQPGAPLVTVEEVLRSHFSEREIPVLMGFPSGHGKTNVPLPLGHEVELDADSGQIRVHSSPVLTRG